ncbi:MAG: EamA family transporter [Alphaproteobacteria bacterium]|nr:EamA family transporter [Alphaproteobacteria bacterium]
MTWIIFAFLAALFAALTSILAKIGLDGISSNVATAIRTIVILIMSWGIVFFTGAHSHLNSISSKNWWFLIASGLATGASWLCYFKALQIGDVSKVVAIDKFSLVLTIVLAALFLSETMTLKVVAGCLLITIGTLLMII